MANETTEIAALEATVRKNLEPRTMRVCAPDGAGAEVLLLPSPGGGMQAVSTAPFVDPTRPRPLRRKGTAKLDTIESFIDHTNRHSGATSAIFVSKTSLTAIYNYNEGGGGTAGLAHFGDHRAVFDPKLSDEWRAWTERSGVPMDQEDFGAFIDAHIADLVDPPETITPGTLLDTFRATGARLANRIDVVNVSEQFTLRVDSEIVGMRNLDNGTLQVSYKETTKGADGGDVRVPRAFVIAIPVFELGPLALIPARLRFKKSGGQVLWSFDLWEPKRAMEAEVSGMIERIRKPTPEGCGLPVFRGTPEP